MSESYQDSVGDSLESSGDSPFKDTAHESFMSRALELAEMGRGLTAPNPSVGAVVVREGTIVGEGYHARVGGPHAEVLALTDAGKQARGATMYVTLEPCSHQGVTGPCVEEIVRAGITELFFGAVDANPQVNGVGESALRSSGIVTHRGPLQKRCERQHEIHLHRFRGASPFVILKSAQTLDGRIASADGSSRWISGEDSLQLAHRLRAEVDAVVIGSGTLREDNPQLTVRHLSGRNPFRIILSASGELDSQLRLFSENEDKRTILVTSAEQVKPELKESAGLIIWRVASDGQGVDLSEFLALAWRSGLRSLLVEGGATLGTSFLKAGLVDKHMIVIAPKILGSGVTAIGDIGVGNIGDCLNYTEPSFEILGTDVVFSGYPQNRAVKGANSASNQKEDTTCSPA